MVAFSQSQKTTVSYIRYTASARIAVQGKLVEQCPEEDAAEELYLQIQAEKQGLS